MNFLFYIQVILVLILGARIWLAGTALFALILTASCAKPHRRSMASHQVSFTLGTSWIYIFKRKGKGVCVKIYCVLHTMPLRDFHTKNGPNWGSAKPFPSWVVCNNLNSDIQIQRFRFNPSSDNYSNILSLWKTCDPTEASFELTVCRKKYQNIY